MEEVKRRLQSIGRTGVLIALVFLSGCTSVPVGEDLSQSQATEIVAVLAELGISSQADRETGGHGQYTVSVKRQFYTQAVTILHERGLPKAEEPTFADTISAKGFLPNSREIESLRVDRAIAAEIEEALRVHPGIAGIKAVVRRASSDQNSSSGVSVIVQEKEGMYIDRNEITQVVLKAVPGMQIENVYVSVLETAPMKPIRSIEGADNVEGRVIHVPLEPFLGFWRVPEGDLPGLSLVLLTGILLIGGLGAFLGYWFGYLQQARQIYDPSLPDLPRPLRQIERVRRQEEEM